MDTSKANKRVIIVHGWDGKPDSNWFPWLQDELEQRGFEVHVPQMPGGEHPKLSQWVHTIGELVAIPDMNTYFVGHSLGAIAIVRYLETLPLDMNVGGAVFVAGFAKDLDVPEIAEFTREPVNFEKVKAQAKSFVAIASRDDGQVPLDIALDFQKSLGAELILENNAGHFNYESNTIYLEPALQSILKMAD